MKISRLSAALCAAMLVLGSTPGIAKSAPNAEAPKPPRIVNRVAATVNGRPITSSEVRNRLMPYLRELQMLYPKQGPRFNAELIKAKKAVLEELIERELVLSDFETKGFNMPESAVDDEINRRILSSFGGKRDNLLDMLRQSGMTFSEYRDSVRKEITAAAMRSSRYEAEIPPTPDEIRAEYEATKSDYRDILEDTIRYQKIFIPAIPDEREVYELVSVPNTDPTYEEQLQLAARTVTEHQYKLAEEIVADIESGKTTFAQAAKDFSADYHANDGGQWPALKRKELSVEFANIAFSAPKGKIIGPLLDPAGFTIVKVQSKTLAPAPPLSNKDVKDRVDDACRRKQSEARYRQWVERLRSTAIIRTYI